MLIYFRWERFSWSSNYRPIATRKLHQELVSHINFEFIVLARYFYWCCLKHRRLTSTINTSRIVYRHMIIFELHVVINIYMEIITSTSTNTHWILLVFMTLFNKLILINSWRCWIVHFQYSYFSRHLFARFRIHFSATNGLILHLQIRKILIQIVFERIV